MGTIENRFNGALEDKIIELAISAIKEHEFFQYGCHFESEHGINPSVRVTDKGGVGMVLSKVSVVDFAMGELISKFYLLASTKFDLSTVERVYDFPFEVPDFEHYYKESLSMNNLLFSHSLDELRIIGNYIKDVYAEELERYYAP